MLTQEHVAIPGLVPNQHQTRHSKSPPEWYRRRHRVHPRRCEYASRGPLGHGEVAAAHGWRHTVGAHDPYGVGRRPRQGRRYRREVGRACWYRARGPVESGVYQVTTSMNCCPIRREVRWPTDED